MDFEWELKWGNGNCVTGIDLYAGVNGDYTGNGGPGAALNNCLIASPDTVNNFSNYDASCGCYYWWDPYSGGYDLTAPWGSFFGYALTGGGNNATINVDNCTIDSFGELTWTATMAAGRPTSRRTFRSSRTSVTLAAAR